MEEFHTTTVEGMLGRGIETTMINSVTVPSPPTKESCVGSYDLDLLTRCDYCSIIREHVRCTNNWRGFSTSTAVFRCGLENGDCPVLPAHALTPMVQPSRVMIPAFFQHAVLAVSFSLILF